MPHGPLKELLQKLDRAREMVQIGGLYRHRSGGGLYRVDDIVLREEDLTPAVVYRAVDGAAISWDRKINIFLDRFHRVEVSIHPSPETKD